MISILLRDARWRLLLLALVAFGFYQSELEIRAHGAIESTELGPYGLSAPMAYLAALTMIVLLAGFISTDRREGYSRIFFSHPTSPLAYYALRWGLALALALAAAFLFFFAVQGLLWGEFRGGWAALVLPLLNALVYGGLIAFFSAALPRGDFVVVALLFLPTLVPEILDVVEMVTGPSMRQLVLFLLPPQTAMQEVYAGLLEGRLAWAAIAFAAGYGLVWLGLATALVRAREWP